MMPIAAAVVCSLMLSVLSSVLVVVQSYEQWAVSVADMSHDGRVLAGAGAALGAMSMVGGAYLTRNQWGEKKVRPNRKYWRGCMRMPEGQFKSNFRVEKATFLWLRKRMWKKVTRDEKERRAAVGDKRKRGGRTMSHAVFTRKLLMTMWFLATGCTYREVGEQFGFYTDYRTLLIDEIASMRDNYVQWPATDADVMRVAAEFAEMRGFTGCVGAIDGTYIRILGPWMRTVAPEEYNTYKKFYATTLLAVADTHLKIRYMNVGWPGSRTDSHVLKQSDLYRNPQSYIHSGFYVFGDSGF